MKKILSAALAAAIVMTSFPSVIALAADSCVYEAESAYTGGWAVRTSDSSASGGALVTNIGGTNTDIGTVVFDVWADAAGTYSCEIAYKSTYASSFKIRVNENGFDGWDNEKDLTVTTSASSKIQTTTQSIQLNAGWNTVKIYSTEGFVETEGWFGITKTEDRRIGIDKITVNAAGRTLDGVVENTVSGVGTARTVYMAKDQSVSSNASFTVTADSDGVYDLNVWYSAYNFRAMQIHVDGTLVDTVLCPITGEDYNIETISKKLSLTKGNHTISFSNSNSTPPEIDKIQLLKSSSSIGSVTSSGVREFGNSNVSVKYNLATGKADFISGGVTRVKGFESAVKVEKAAGTGNGEMINTVVKSSDYTTRTVKESAVGSGFGIGTRYDVVMTADGLPDMTQSFYIYNDLDYILTSVEISSPNGVSTNFMAPIAAAGSDVVNIGTKSDTRSLYVPFANDNYETYDPQYLAGNHTSYWVTCLFDNNTRNSVVAGSVDHDTWKTGTSTYGTANNGNVNFFGAFAGIWSRLHTYDFLPHGSLEGETVTSPKMFLGYFDDWRDGMEAYGEANNKNQPRLNWDGGNIFGYSSWNAYGEDVSLSTMKTAADVVDGLGDFHDENDVQWINIDSYWDNLTQGDDSQLKEYVAYCKEKGQKVGIYTSRFICWDDDLWNWGVRGYAITDKYGNPVAPAKPDSTYGTVTNCFAFDPTSNDAKSSTKSQMEYFKSLGFEYVKIDFMNFAAVEGVFQDSSVKTGLQAYNQACAQILEHIDPDKFFVDYSIAPLFPHQYAHARRVSCDVWTEGDSNLEAAEYMLNSLNYSWWQSGTVYEFLDPDQISVNISASGSDDIAKAKYTTGVITGMMVLSNQYATSTSKNRTATITGNSAVNDVARIGRAFRPLKATDPCPTQNAATPCDTYTLETDDAFYIAVFNLSGSSATKTIDLVDAGLESGKSYSVTELWSSSTSTATNTLSTGSMAGYNCKLYKIPIEKAATPTVEIESASILNSDNSSEIYGGDTVHSSVTATDGATVKTMLCYSTDNGKTYLEMAEGSKVPVNANSMMLVVTASIGDVSTTKTVYVNVGQYESVGDFVIEKALWTEDFDSADSVTVDDVLNSQKGWTTYYADNNAYGIGGYVGQGVAFGNGNVLNARMNTWCASSKSRLDINANAEARGRQTVDWNANRRAVLNLDFIFDPAYLDKVGNLQNGAEHKVKVLNDYDNELINIASKMSKGDNDSNPTATITINIMGESAITYVTDTNFSGNANNVYNKPFNLKVFREGDLYGGKLLIMINDDIIKDPNGNDWHTINGSVNLQRVEIENWYSNWYGGVSIDNLVVSPWHEKIKAVDAIVETTDAKENGLYGDYNFAAALVAENISGDMITNDKFTWVVDVAGDVYAKEFTGTVITSSGNVSIGAIVSGLDYEAITDAKTQIRGKLYLGEFAETGLTIQ